MNKPLYVALHVASLLLGFAAAWSIRADQVADARARAHAADLTQQGASEMADGLDSQLDECIGRLQPCELGLDAAEAALNEAESERWIDEQAMTACHDAYERCKARCPPEDEP